LEFDRIRVLTKDWDSFYTKGAYYQDEIVLVNSYKNAFKSDPNSLKFIPKKPSFRKRFGVRWKE
jgi:hypothetical protein